MNFENLQIRKIISHFIYQPDHSGYPIVPIISQELITLEIPEKNLLTERLVKVLGADSKSVVMQISDYQSGLSLIHI